MHFLEYNQVNARGRDLWENNTIIKYQRYGMDEINNLSRRVPVSYVDAYPGS